MAPAGKDMPDWGKLKALNIGSSIIITRSKENNPFTKVEAHPKGYDINNGMIYFQFDRPINRTELPQIIKDEISNKDRTLGDLDIITTNEPELV